MNASHDMLRCSPPPRSPMRIAVLGYIIRGPIGGMAWHHLNYVAGLHRMGHDVVFFEDSDDYESCYDPSRHVVDTDPTYGMAFAQDAFHRLNMSDRWAYFDAHRNQWRGPMGPRALEFCKSADLMINISGVNDLREWTANIPLRLLIDTDPAFTQIRHLNDPSRMAYARQHNRFATFGENIANGTADLPDDGLPWRATRQPIVLEEWPYSPPCPTGPLTTVMQWDSYKTQTYNGVQYGMKSRSFEGYLDLPARTGARLTLALGGHGAPQQQFHDHGWALDDPLAVTRNPWTYQQYIQASRAEWTVAKHGYVISRSGWFSERSACYMASGRPVITQDTGFGSFLPVGQGVLTFATPDQAAEAISALSVDYEQHCRAARRIAEEYFAAPMVLGNLLNQIDTAEAVNQATSQVDSAEG